MTWDKKHCRWKLWDNRPAKMIGRMYFVGPNGEERFYLWMLLTIVKGPLSFEDLCTWNGVIHPTLKSACVACGLLDSDDQWDRSLTEAELWQEGSQLHELFACISLHYQPADPLQLWMNHAQHVSDDCRHKLQTIRQIANPSEEQVWVHSNIL